MPGAVACQTCPDHSFSEAGNSNVSACLCNAGYSGKPGVSCFPCAPGFFKVERGSGPCQRCPAGTYAFNSATKVVCTECTAHSSTVTDASNSVGNCLCNAGHTGALGGPCTPCAEGTFSPDRGPEPCQLCASGTYSTKTQQTTNTTCKACPTYSISDEGSSAIIDCICDSGYSAAAAGAACVPCDVGTYKEATGSTPCDVCSRNTYQAKVAQTSATSCLACPAHSISPFRSGALEMCVCKSAYTQVDSSQLACEACDSGKWKTSNGSAVCSLCAPGKYSMAPAQKVEAACLACPVHSLSPEGSSDKVACKCLAGYTGEDGEGCAQCTQGKYKSETGSSACIVCGPNTYSNGTASTACLTCQQDAVAVTGSSLYSDCKCTTGFSSLGDVCSACEAGQYKKTLGTSGCLACEAGKYSDSVASSLCTLCPDFAHSPTGANATTLCTCNRGFTGPDGGPGACIPCKAGEYKGASGSTQCLVCAGGYYSPAAASSCTRCPRNSSSPPQSVSIESCFCDFGFFGVNGGDCSPCEIGWYCQGGASIACAENTASDASSALISDCLCQPGFEGNAGGPCQQCNSGTYCDIGVLYDCPVSAGSAAGSSLLSHCTCREGFWGPDGGECSTCEKDSYCRGGPQTSLCPDNSFSPAGSTSIQHCICGPGYVGPNGGPCVHCPRYFFCEGGDTKEDCQNHGDAPMGSLTISDCLCERGFVGDPGGVCVECPENHFCAGGSQKIECPADTEAWSGSWLEADCSCSSGLSGPLGGPCSECVSNAFCFVGREIPCPAFSEAPAGSLSLEACVCIPGTYGLVTNGGCVACEGGRDYCPGGSSAAQCLENSFSPAQSSTLEDCLCDSGFAGPADGPCTPCEANSFTPYGNDPCSCNKGFTGPDDGTCRACEQGKYKPVNGSGECEPCGAGKFGVDSGATSESACVSCSLFRGSSSSVQGSRSALACLCQAGHSLAADGLTCQPCPAGFYKSFIANTDCSSCQQGKYSMVVGAMSDVCQGCPSNSNAPEASDEEVDCTCNAGSTGPDGGPTCRLCAEGKYQANTGSLKCDDCLGGKYLDSSGNDAEANCKACPANSGNNVAASTTETSCKCNAGSSGALGLCQSCPTGSYKGAVGSTACTLCAAGKFSEALGATAPSTCKECPAHSQAGLGSAAKLECECNAGYTLGAGVEHSCVVCVAGTYKLGIGLEGCIECARDMYSNTLAASSASTCQQCSSSSTAPEGSASIESCLCLKGYSGPDGGTCTDCDPGKYKAGNGASDCLECNPGKISATASATCTQCSTDTYSSVDHTECTECSSNAISPAGSDEIQDCVCAAGFTGPEGGPCTECDAGKYKIATGNAACSNCIAGQYSTAIGATSDVCQGCPMYSNAPEASDEEADCICDAGSSSDGGMCSLCVVGKYKIAPGDAACSNCSAGQYSTAVGATSDVCQGCPSNSDGPEASNEEVDCICQAGSSGPDGGPCTQCVTGKYKVLAGSAKCSNCVAGKFATVVGATSDVCASCPTHSDAPEASDEEVDCACNAGSSGPDGGECLKCVPGAIKLINGSSPCVSCPSGTFARTPNVSCISCPLHSVSAARSASIKDCLCLEGFSGPDGGTCIACRPGTHKSVLGSDTCKSCQSTTYATIGSALCMGCPLYTYAPPESIDVESCVCIAGYTGVDGNECQPCTAGSYKSNKGSSSCRVCPSNSQSPQRSVDVVSCICNKGFSGPHGGRCNNCEVGKYKPSTGSAACTACIPGKYAEEVAQLSEILACVSCPVDTFSPAFSASSSTACLRCKSGSQSASGSADSSNCRCRIGTSGPDGGLCQSCSTGSYKGAVGSTACTPCAAGKFSEALGATAPSTCKECPAHSQAGLGSAAKLDCECNAGYTLGAGVEHSCVACVAGTYKLGIGLEVCVECVAGKYMLPAISGSTSEFDCVECPADFFCNDGQTISACPENTTSPSGSEAAGDCVCSRGYGGTQTSFCQALCGDGIRVKHEQCDDANVMSRDGCTNCLVDCGFSCFDLNDQGRDVCDTECGDSLTRGSEGCDDGNSIDGDGCSSSCTVELGYLCFHDTTEAGTTAAACALEPFTCLQGVCGVGTISAEVQDKKECDDGNTLSEDGCSHDCGIECGWLCSGATESSQDTCSPTECGDSKLSGDEKCDDGNTANSDGCSSNCLIENGWTCVHLSVPPAACGQYPDACAPACGDGVRIGAELVSGGCDDGGQLEGDGCSALCTVECGWNCLDVCTFLCGDGLRATGAEECDDGNILEGDGCSSSCTVELGWECPPYVLMNTCGIDQCSEICGDGLIVGSEACDDSNLRSGDGCGSTCAYECCFERVLKSSGSLAMITKCGDGCWSGVEECDDGNTVDGDGCSSNCQVELGWDCANSNCGQDSCVRICADGRQGPSESCDDGNNRDHDGCSKTCHLEPGFEASNNLAGIVATTCGDGVWAGLEECDDGNRILLDGCSNTCQVEAGFLCFNTGLGADRCTPICGDGRRVADEQCDDGNLVEQDGCDRACRVEPRYQCNGGSSFIADYCVLVVPSIECSRVRVRPTVRGTDKVGLVIHSNLLDSSTFEAAALEAQVQVQTAQRSWRDAFSKQIAVAPEVYLPIGSVFSPGRWVRVRIRGENQHGDGEFCEVKEAIRLIGLPGLIRDFQAQYSHPQDLEPLCVSWSMPEDTGYGVSREASSLDWVRPKIGRRGLLQTKPVLKNRLTLRPKSTANIEYYKGEIAQNSNFLESRVFEESVDMRHCFPAPAGTTWHFRLVACNAAGCSSFDEAPTTSWTVPPEPVLTPPSSPPPGSLSIFSVSPSQGVR